MFNSETIKDSDGRKQRTNDSRQKIVTAMLSLIREGHISPSAEQVATKAEVGLRTVFRRFNEMELLFRELAVETHRAFMPDFQKPLEGNTWQEKLINVIERKVKIYEFIRPIKEAANYHVHTSAFIREDDAYWNEMEKKILEKVLPFNQQENMPLFHGINGCMSFSYWHTLVTAHGLTQAQALDTIKITVHKLIKDI